MPQKSSWSEDDLVASVARRLRASGWAVLASGAIQGGFRVPTLSGLYKSPDLVAVQADVAIIAEAKLRPGDLLRDNGRGASDIDFLIELSTEQATRDAAATSISAKCRAVGLDAGHRKLLPLAICAREPDAATLAAVRHLSIIVLGSGDAELVVRGRLDHLLG